MVLFRFFGVCAENRSSRPRLRALWPSNFPSISGPKFYDAVFIAPKSVCLADTRTRYVSCVCILVSFRVRSVPLLIFYRPSLSKSKKSVV